ncbi:MAG: polysaccharide deacetylase family protein [Chitinivibrionales bacterium]|nr:polysaccharide deacetylase family protein [Chitinivibrionales bacterium]
MTAKDLIMKPFEMLALGIMLQATYGAAAPTVSIASFKHDKPAAASFTFDDGFSSGYQTVAPLFDEFGFKATFYITPGGSNNWNKWKEIAQNGHEVGNHTYNHRNPNQMAGDSAVIHKQVIESRDIIIGKTGIEVFSYAYPGCKYTVEFRDYVLQHHPIDRPCGEIYGGNYTVAQANELILKAFEGTHTLRPTTAPVGELLETSSRWGHDPGWACALAHNIADGGGFRPWPADSLRRHLEFVKTLEESLWVDTYINVGLYVMERDSATVEVVSHSSSDVTVGVSLPSSMNADWYTAPLTLIIEDGGEKRLYDLVPSADPVAIKYADTYRKGGTVNVRTSRKSPVDSKMLRLWGKRLVLPAGMQNSARNVGIFSVDGVRIASYRPNPKRQVIDLSHLNTGTYVLKWQMANGWGSRLVTLYERR